MHTEHKNENDTQTNAALAANIHTAIALWQAKDWTGYKTMRDTLMDLIRSGYGDEIGIEQMQFIYFVNTHLRYRVAREVGDRTMFLVTLPATKPAGDAAWTTATEGRFWTDPL